jgi:hypothetical protein
MAAREQSDDPALLIVTQPLIEAIGVTFDE